MQLSVIICTHNPRPDYLRRTLDALQTQTLPRDQWELLLIDNASAEPLADGWDLTWHPHARHIREDELGLTPARLCGIKQAQGEILVFSDDDNVLASNYLSEALAIGKARPFLGAWGGQKHPEFEVAPPDWTRPYWRCLAIVEFNRDAWSNFGHGDSLPCGAGMCVRKALAARYASLLKSNPLRKYLGRRGKSLMSGEDTDLVQSIYDAGYGSGLFTNLHLQHLIGENRVTVEYFSRICESMAISGVFFDYIYNQPAKELSFVRRMVWLARALLGNDRRLKIAKFRGERKGKKLLREVLVNNPQLQSGIQSLSDLPPQV